MALRDQPYIPLYVQDYLTDEKLNACSPATQGVYIKIMCILHKSDEYGKILLKQKDKQNESKIKNFASKLNKQLTFTIEDIESALIELIEEKVMTIEGDVLFQKRMVKDGEISEKRAFAANRSVEARNKNDEFATAKESAKRSAKAQQNPENENEYENEDVIDKENDNSSLKKVIKHKYGSYSNVLLSDEDYAKLVQEFPSDYQDRIERLSEYIASKGAKYKNHLATIRSWARKDAKDSPVKGLQKGADAPLPPGWKFSDIDMGGKKCK